MRVCSISHFSVFILWSLVPLSGQFHNPWTTSRRWGQSENPMGQIQSLRELTALSEGLETFLRCRFDADIFSFASFFLSFFHSFLLLFPRRNTIDFHLSFDFVSLASSMVLERQWNFDMRAYAPVVCGPHRLVTELTCVG